MGAVRTVLIAVALFSAPVSAVASVSMWDGFFVDASDDADPPTEVDKPGTYGSHLDAPDDRDWYFLDREGWESPGHDELTCLELEFRGGVQAATYLWTDSVGADDYAKSGVEPVDDALMGLVVPGFSAAYFGIASNASTDLVAAGPYEFTIDVHTITDLPEDPFMDGLPACASLTIPAGGFVEQSFTLEEARTLVFSTADGKDLSVTLQGQETDVDAELLDLSTKDTVTDVDLEPDTYTLHVASDTSEDRDILTGFTLGPDDDDDDDHNGRPCQPHC